MYPSCSMLASFTAWSLLTPSFASNGLSSRSFIFTGLFPRLLALMGLSSLSSASMGLFPHPFDSMGLFQSVFDDIGLWSHSCASMSLSYLTAFTDLFQRSYASKSISTSSRTIMRNCSRICISVFSFFYASSRLCASLLP
jgi:hypothetical protein